MCKMEWVLPTFLWCLYCTYLILYTGTTMDITDQASGLVMHGPCVIYLLCCNLILS
jgi:hypothetical protein